MCTPEEPEAEPELAGGGGGGAGTSDLTSRPGAPLLQAPRHGIVPGSAAEARDGGTRGSG